MSFVNNSKAVSAADDSTIDITSQQSGVGFIDITSEIDIRGTGLNNPTWATFREGISALSFSASAMNEAWAVFHIPHGYYQGSSFYIHAHWSTTGTNNGVARFGFEYTVAKGHNQSVFGATTTVYVEQAASGTAYKHMIAETAAITSAEMEVDALILVRIFRDAAHANDTLSDALFMFTSDVHLQVDRVSTINKAPNFYG
jgi:hypothetical protein